jgi:hypothetical protein
VVSAKEYRASRRQTVERESTGESVRCERLSLVGRGGAFDTRMDN